MRILVVTDQYAPMVGGVPAVTRTLAAGLAERGHSVTILAPGDGVRSGTGMDGRVAVSYSGSLPWPWYPGLRLATMPVRAVRELMSAAAPDVIHSHSPLTLGFLARRRAGRCDVPVVYTNHYLPANVTARPGGGSRLLEASFYSWIVGYANRCGYVTAPSATALELLRSRGLRVRSGVVSNGVDTGTYAPGPAAARVRERYQIRDDQPVILSVGRLSREKRVDLLIEAVSMLTGPAQLVIAGAGPAAGALRELAARLGLAGPGGQVGRAGRVAFAGHVPDTDLPDLYRAADIFAIASEAELQSLATMEAMASGLPVVAAGACALPELVTHGSNGYLFPAGDSAGLARYLDLLVAPAGRRPPLGRASRRRIGPHGLAGALAEWESVYATLAGAGA